MGIRFHCQNCEKRLNVKTAQAGEYGQCPFCLAKILVPVQSTVTSTSEPRSPNDSSRHRSSETDGSSIGLHAVDEQVTIDGIPAEELHRRVRAKTPQPQSANPPPPATGKHMAAELFMLDKPELPPSLGKVDPITQAPNQIWYFRSRELGERGPLKPKAMREYVDQGDVTVGCIVWRQDWNDWLPAERVFPKLAAEVAGIAPGDAAPPNPTVREPLTLPELRQRRKQRIFFAAVLFGVLLIGILLVIVLKLIANDL